MSGFSSWIPMKQMHTLPRLNWRNSRWLRVVVVLMLLWSCKSRQLLPESAPLEEVTIDSTEVSDSESIVEENGLVELRENEISEHNPSATREFDILHTDLDLLFDFSRQAVQGKVVLTLKPYAKDQNVLVLDAKDFELGKILFSERGKEGPVNYSYDEKQLRIYLPRALTRTDTFKIFFDYTAFPERNAGNGSEAITDTKGLYFIDPLDTVNGKPRMIWTQGETEHNSKWFPTIDKPNERFTQTIKLTIPDSMVSISNGELVRQEKMGNGLRKDYWELNMPHAPYLAAFAIGDFGKVEDRWENIPLGYYVEKGYEKGAAKVFGNTPEMMGFFSTLLGVKYPWPNYDQVVVRDFVSGAMENTTASIFMEQLRLNEREAIDSEWDYIIAHELFHQWFGDYVTIESWANLTLNEAFANYSEYLWNEYKYGADQAKLKLVAEMENYFLESMSKQVDLIRFDYDDAEDMFDSHSYAKGGVVLHMLRTYLGDELFFEALKKYLEDNALKSVEIHNLRLAMEYVSGEDLNWFFNQWFLDKGHPELVFDVDYSQPENILISISQVQDLKTTPLYRLPVEVSWYESGTRKTNVFMLEKAFQQFALENRNPVTLVYIDEGKNLLAARSQKLSPSQLIQQYRESVLGVARYEALDSLASSGAAEELRSIISEALQDGFWSIRESALSIVQGNPDWLESDPTLEGIVVKMAQSDRKNSVKSAALDVLTDYAPDKYHRMFMELAKDSSYVVAGSALTGLLKGSTAVAPDLIGQFAVEDNFRIAVPVADYYITNSIEEQGGWFMDKIKTMDGEGLYYFLGYFSEYFGRFPEEGKENAVNFLLEKMEKDPRNFIRLGAFQALMGFADDEAIVGRISSKAALETDAELKRYYDYFLEALIDEN